MTNVTKIQHIHTMATMLAHKRRCTDENGCHNHLGTGPYHAATFFKNKSNNLSYGENKFKGEEGQWTIHAEDSALRKLQTLPKKKKLDRVNMLIIRTSKSGVLGNSKPCLHCIVLLYKKLPAKGYVLDNVYYSDANGDIQQVKLIDLINDNNPHVSMYYANRGATVLRKNENIIHHCDKC